MLGESVHHISQPTKPDCCIHIIAEYDYKPMFFSWQQSNQLQPTTRFCCMSAVDPWFSTCENEPTNRPTDQPTSKLAHQRMNQAVTAIPTVAAHTFIDLTNQLST